MGEPLEVRPLLRAKRFEDLVPETKALKELKPSFTRKEHSRITSASFSPVAPYRLAVVSGTKVGIWQPAALKEGALEEGKSLTKFKDVTLCASWRSDGKLLLVGEASGSCAVIEVEKNTILRRLRGHGDAVTCAAYAETEKSRCATGCKDGKLRLWDVVTSELLSTMEAHDDCLKCCAVGPVGAGSWITAGHDQMVKLWDERSKPDKPAIAVNHGSPVECGCAFPGAALYASGGGTAVKVWDLAMTGKVLQELNDAHSKVIMDLDLDDKAATLISASFDGFVKVFNSVDFTHLCSYKQTGPCTCVAWRPDGNGLMVGLDDGSWQFRSRAGKTKKKAVGEGELVVGKRVLRRGKKDGPLKDEDDDEEEESEVEIQKSKKWKREEGFLRGHLHQPELEDHVVDQQGRTGREPKVTYLFRKFEYRKLAEYLFYYTKPREPSYGLSIVSQLLEQGALASALSEMGEELCFEALRWLQGAYSVSSDSLQQSLINELLLQLIDCNECLRPPQSQKLIGAMEKVEQMILKELQNQEALFETTGAIESIFS